MAKRKLGDDGAKLDLLPPEGAHRPPRAGWDPVSTTHIPFGITAPRLSTCDMFIG
eukprot:gene4745-4428_t